MASSSNVGAILGIGLGIGALMLIARSGSSQEPYSPGSPSDEAYGSSNEAFERMYRGRSTGGKESLAEKTRRLGPCPYGATTCADNLRRKVAPAPRPAKRTPYDPWDTQSVNPYTGDITGRPGDYPPSFMNEGMGPQVNTSYYSGDFDFDVAYAQTPYGYVPVRVPRQWIRR